MARLTTHDWVEGVSPDDVRQMIERTFEFLVTDRSFRRPVDTSINTLVIALRYSGANLAIEPLVDRKERFVETCIVRLRNGSRPEGWKIDDEGNQFMTRLFEAARDRKIRRATASRVPASPHEALQILLDAEVETLREGFPDFLADEDRYFGDLNRRRAEHKGANDKKSFFAKAEELFNGKQYSTLVDHLGSAEYKLSELWEARLAYATKHT